jgi:ADP-ribosylglycohydrolase
MACLASRSPASAETPASSNTPTDSRPAQPDLTARIHGLLLGTALGDALGGPIEFQPRDAVQKLPSPPVLWDDDQVLDAPARRAAQQRLRLRRYQDLRPAPESYGHWNTNALPGTVTDDTRHKLILLHALHQTRQADAWPLDRRQFAQAHLDWPRQPAIALRPDYVALAQDWLEEWQFAARWILGEREPNQAKPPERMWQGLPTCSGQMSLLPIAAIHAGRPNQAYRAAYQLGFFDNGFGKDLNAALVAALSVALTVPLHPAQPGAAWRTVLEVLRGTDPYHYGRIRWTTRAVDRWLDLAMRLVKDAQQRPARLFAALEREFQHTTKWEAQVPFTVAFACLAIAEYDPLAALQLSLEWGHDTDSYAQVVGAFIGALHGPTLFPADWTQAVADRLRVDFGTDLAAEARFLTELHSLAGGREIIAER